MQKAQAAQVEDPPKKCVAAGLRPRLSEPAMPAPRFQWPQT